MGINATAVKTTWETHHARGHRVCKTVAAHDLSTRRPSERPGHRRWPATTDCSDCRNARRHAVAAQERTAGLAGRRGEEPAETAPWQTRTGMPLLDGPDKAVERGRQVRHQLLTSASHDTHDILAVPVDDFAVRVGNPARRVGAASWWACPWSSSQRHGEPADLEEQGSDGASHDAAATSGSPY